MRKRKLTRDEIISLIIAAMLFLLGLFTRIFN